MDPANAISFGQDLAEEILGSGNMVTENRFPKRIRIGWSSMALAFIYNEIGSDETVPIIIDEQYCNIHKSR
ncbi:hypothetical protein [Methanococcoides sp. FTZ1]|uniref:hypothetical protein n=1 Tax=Methanococcoides sp. FTZ1 TaxID=3439061 RepID=UPI003F83360D